MTRFTSCTREDLEQFRAFLRSLVMHAAVGTALGGVTTLVGEPQNLLIATTAGWDFQEFFVRMLPVSAPVLLIGFATCALMEKLRWFGYGAELPQRRPRGSRGLRARRSGQSHGA